MTRPRVVVAGWHGADADRDHLALSVIASGLQARRPDVEVIGVGPDPMAITTRNGLPGVPIADPVAFDAMLQGAAGLLVVGGPPWRDAELTAMGGLAGLFAFEAPGGPPRRWQLSLPAVLQVLVLAVIRGVPVHLHGLQLESFDDVGGLQLVALLARSAASLTAADQETADRLVELTALRDPVPVIAGIEAALDLVAPLLPEVGGPPGLPAGRLRMRRES
jgi:hypothetical protein